jgi:hypothetical protein
MGGDSIAIINPLKRGFMIANYNSNLRGDYFEKCFELA